MKLQHLDDTPPLHVVHHQRQVAEEKAMKLLERKERPHMDDDEMREIGCQNVGVYNFLK